MCSEGILLSGVSSTCLPLCRRRKGPRCLVNGRLGLPQIRLGCFGDEEGLHPCRERTTIARLSSPQRADHNDSSCAHAHIICIVYLTTPVMRVCFNRIHSVKRFQRLFILVGKIPCYEVQDSVGLS